VPAAEIEARVGCAVREHLADCTDSDDGDLIRSHVVRVAVHADQLVVELKAEASSDPPNAVDNERLVLRVPWQKTPMKRRREIIVPAFVSSGDRRPIRAETRVTLVASIARGRRWLDEVMAGTVTGVEQIAARDKCSIRQVNMTISLAFLAPGLVKAAVEGRLPRGIGVTRLRDAPLSGRANTRCSACRFDPGGLHAQSGTAPGTGLASPETGSQNRRYRDLARRQRPHARYLNRSVMSR
jgi:site-specific DNA recombinase